MTITKREILRIQEVWELMGRYDDLPDAAFFAVMAESGVSEEELADLFGTP